MPDIARVLLTTSTFPNSDDDRITARFVLDLARHLSAHVEVVVLAPAAPGTPPRERWEGAGTGGGDVTVLRYRYFAPARLQMVTRGGGALATLRSSLLAKSQVPLFVAAQWAAIPRIVRRERIDLVNSHWIVPQGFTSALWRRRLGRPHVVTAHAADVAFLARFAGGRPLARFIFDRTDFFLPVSGHLATQVEELVGRPVPHRVIPMGAAAGLFQPTGTAANLRRCSGERIVLYVGKLVPKKGVSVLLEAVGRLRAKEVPVRLVLVGGGPLEREVHAQVVRLGLEGVVDRVGWVRNDELPEWYRGADVVCIPSVRDEHGETEGTPVVLQEALASGSVVVASEISGIPDMVRDGVNGWLAPPGNAEELARVLHRALSLGEADRTRMRRAAREMGLDHTWERVAERYMESFREAARRAGPVRADAGQFA
jgi:glycosyltransferase involved in cell wall biosynthesis